MAEEPDRVPSECSLPSVPPRYLPGVHLGSNLVAEPDLARAVEGPGPRLRRPIFLGRRYPQQSLAEYGHLSDDEGPRQRLGGAKVSEQHQGATMLIFVTPHQFVKGLCPKIKPVMGSGAKALSLIKGMDVTKAG